MKNTIAVGKAKDYRIPTEILVLPVFFVPDGEKKPKESQYGRVTKHLKWSQARYNELLGNHTFKITREVITYNSDNQISAYQNLKGGEQNKIAGELLRFLRVNRYNCPYILFTVFQCSSFEFPPGFGRPFNGGYNTGGGICLVSSFALNQLPNFQSTIQHELGHAFGLPHVDAYGYDMSKCDSLMSYNQAHHTAGFSQSSTPGVFIDEDRRGLALNQRVFPGLTYDIDETEGHNNNSEKEIKVLEKMEIVDQPDQVSISTNSGETVYSKVSNIFQNIIRPSIDLGNVAETYDPKNMWHSDSTTTGWVYVEFLFPYAIDLTGIGIHSQHSGSFHAATAICIEVKQEGGYFSKVGEFDLHSIDQKINFLTTGGQNWKFGFKATESNHVVIRGLQFYSGSDEIYCPLIPWNF
jgi:hypothetical protein